jgi:hypothetical protein
MEVVERSSFERAVDNVASRGDTDVFPFPIENHVFHDKRDDVVDYLLALSADHKSRLSGLTIPKHSSLASVGYAGYRWTTQIDPAWNAYLLGLVVSMAPSIEAARIDPEENTVFSYRYDPEPANGLFEVDAWKRFQDRCLDLASRYQYVVSVDIADFYSRVYHHRLENALREVDNSSFERTSRIMEILANLSGGTSYGLPVGGNAARLLSELVLNRVDRLLLAQSEVGEFCRYADDYRFFVRDIQSAHRCIGMLSEKLMRNEGFSLQKAKTRIFTSAEYELVTEAHSQNDPGSAGRFLGLRLHFDPYSVTAIEDYERMMLQMSEFDILGMLRDEITKGRIHISLTKRLVAALRYMEEESRVRAIVSLLENVEVLAPIIPQVMLAVRDCLDDIGDHAAVDSILAIVRKLVEEDHYVAKNDLNLAYIVRVLGARKSRENERMLIRLYSMAHGYDSKPAPNIQRDIVLTMAKWDARYWLSERKHSIGSDPEWVKRAFRIASFSLSDEGRHWRQKNKPMLGSFEAVVGDWAASRSSNPNWTVPV